MIKETEKNQATLDGFSANVACYLSYAPY